MSTMYERGAALQTRKEAEGTPVYVHRSNPEVIGRAIIAIRRRREQESRVFIDGRWQ
jgi:hypothetical protein